jgi:hypothetical protein
MPLVPISSKRVSRSFPDWMTAFTEWGYSDKSRGVYVAQTTPLWAMERRHTRITSSCSPSLFSVSKAPPPSASSFYFKREFLGPVQIGLLPANSEVLWHFTSLEFMWHKPHNCVLWRGGLRATSWRHTRLISCSPSLLSASIAPPIPLVSIFKQESFSVLFKLDKCLHEARYCDILQG